MKRHHVLPFGAEPVAEGVRFRLWAPSAAEVRCAIDGAPARDLPMQPEGGGWFSLTTEAARAGSRYRYVVDGMAVADPASRHQPSDVHGPSEVIDPASYEWRDDAWPGRPWEEIVLYELHTGTFTASGDFAGIARRLDHLARLGVTAVELMPVADFPGRRNWGYDGVLLFAPDSRYGRPEDMKRLVEACHERGIAILLDVVYNHFGPDGNYLHAYAKDFFTRRHPTPWGEAINFDGPASDAVRQFFLHNALYWLEEFHLDGLRFDAVHAIRDDRSPDILTEIAQAIRTRFAGERPIHLILENDANNAHWLERTDGVPRLYTAQWSDDIHHALRVLTTGKTDGYYADYAERPADKLGRALAEGFAYQGAASAFRGGRKRGTLSAQLPPTAFLCFVQNHDQVGNDAFGTRIVRQAGTDAIHAAVAISLLSPHVPMLFMGEEWGADQPFCFFCDFTGDLAVAVREGRRREFASSAGFQDPAMRERIPDPGAEATFAASVLDWSALDQPAHAAWLERYRRMIALRTREIVPRLPRTRGHAGRWRALGEAVLRVDWMLGDGSLLALVSNFSERPLVVPEMPEAGRLLYATATRATPDEAPPHSAIFFLSVPELE
jgi:malto-oligosyltrehalose trehalohydrolase